MGSRPRNSTRPKKRSRQQRERRADAILAAAKAVEPACTEQEPLPPTGTALREIRQELNSICSCVIVVRHALTEQNVELDEDAALVLKRHVSDPLFEQVLRIGHLLGDDNEAGGLS
jgi:hypothetical protein